MPGTLVLVATPIGNLEDITLRALRVLKEAALIAAEDTRRTAKLLNHFGITTPTLSLHGHNEPQRIARILDRVTRGDTVALVSDAGTPVISDPGLLLVRAAIQAGLPVEVLPGASALIVAAAGSGIVATTTSFIGFPPSRAGERRRWLEGLVPLPGALVLFEAPHRLAATLRSMLDVLGDREVVVAHELTKVHESWHRGTLSQVASDPSLPTKGEFTIVVGPAVAVDRIAEPPGIADIEHQFGHLTNERGLSRKQAITELAQRHHLPKRQIYALVEQAKISVK